MEEEEVEEREREREAGEEERTILHHHFVVCFLRPGDSSFSLSLSLAPLSFVWRW